MWAALAALLLAPLPAVADHCLTWTTTTTGYGFPLIEADGRYILIAQGFCDPQCGYSFWIYEESNMIDGLQRGDEFQDDTCHGMIAPDTLVF